MSKMKKSKKEKKTISGKSSQNLLENMKPWQQIFAGIVIIVVVTFIVFSDLTIKGMTPAGGDVIASKGKTNQMKQYQDQTGEKSLWNPAIFCGMPQYHRFGPQSWSLDILASYFFDENAGQVVVYYIIGATGMFVLLYSLNFPFLIAFFGALAFLLMPHYNSLWIAGHFSKFRAIMYIPWVIAAFFYFLDKRNLLSILLFTLAFSLQLRTQHYQIIFYTALILFAIGIYPVIKLIAEKKLFDLVKILAYFMLGVILILLSVYQPFFPMKEYTPYSTRGGNPVHIEQLDASAGKAKGVSFDYATKWSLSPRETICFLIPRYFGGTSQEKYMGKDVPQLMGREVPGYWGDMPFTSSSDYIGVSLFILLIIGIYGFRKDWKIISLGLFTVFAMLLAFGQHFPAFYKIFFYHLPYFSKFRVPTMIMMAVFVVFIIFAAYGIRYLIQHSQKEDKKIFPVLHLIAGFLFLLCMSPFLLKGTFSFTTAQELSQYNPQVLALLKSVRFEFMKMDAMRTLLFSFLTIGLIFLYLKKIIPQGVFLVTLIMLMMLDVLLVNYRHFDELVKKQDLEEMHFAPDRIDNYLLAQQADNPEPFRVLGVGGLFSNNDLSYFHQTIGGYDAAKMQVIQDIIDNNLYHGWDASLPLNWHVVNFLNGKYLVANRQMMHPNLEFILKEDRKNLFLYQNKSVLPRSFLVGAYQVMPDPVAILKTINTPEFNPATTALLQQAIEQPITVPDTLSFSKVTKYTPNKIELDARTNRQCLLVLSEVYYPKGWRAYIDSKETAIYQTNHILRAIVLPEGQHQVKFVFHPDSFFQGKLIATIANLIVLLAIITLLAIRYRKSIKIRS